MNSALEYTRDVELKGATPNLVLHSDPRSMGGVKRFPGTRVPVSYLFADMAEGVSIEEFCRRHSRVKLEDCRAIVNCAMELVELREERAIERGAGRSPSRQAGNRHGGRERGREVGGSGQWEK